jgi:hypothetical protein
VQLLRREVLPLVSLLVILSAVAKSPLYNARRVDGCDLFLPPKREEWRLECRLYATPEGLRGSPTTDMLREALAEGGTIADPDP